MGKMDEIKEELNCLKAWLAFVIYKINTFKYEQKNLKLILLYMQKHNKCISLRNMYSS